MNGCRYITSLDRPCGRNQTHGRYCRFHSVLHEFEINCGSPVDLRQAIGGLTRG
jgi:hypothetical protein